MADSTLTLVPVEEYLHSTYKPSADYLDGVLRSKPMPTRKHSLIQLRLGSLLLQIPGFEANSELTVRIRDGRFLVPDLAVQDASDIQDPCPTRPVALCVEILSPDDRFSETLAKCDEYINWGVPVTWIIDPENRRAWHYAGKFPEEVAAGGTLTAPSGLAVPLAQVFSVLDR